MRLSVCKRLEGRPMDVSQQLALLKDTDITPAKLVRAVEAQMDEQANERPNPYSSWSFKSLEHVQFMPTQWLIRGHLPKYGVGFLTGDSQSFKTFVAIDMACTVACGLPHWLDGVEVATDVNQGKCLFLVGEGEKAIKKRFEVWQQEYETVPPDQIMIAPRGDLYDPEFTSHLIDTLQTTGFKPNIIIIDTLAKNSSADENSTKEMSRLFGELSDLVQRLDCAILLIHHNNKAGGYRGTTNLMGDVDFFLSCEREGFNDNDPTPPSLRMTLKCKKLKDDDLFKDIQFEASSIELDGLVDEYGIAITSLVLNPVSIGSTTSTATRLAPNESKALRIFEEHHAVRKAELEKTHPSAAEHLRYDRAWLSKACEDTGMSRTTAWRVVNALVEKKAVVEKEGKILPVGG